MKYEDAINQLREKFGPFADDVADALTANTRTQLAALQDQTQILRSKLDAAKLALENTCAIPPFPGDDVAPQIQKLHIQHARKILNHVHPQDLHDLANAYRTILTEYLRLFPHSNKTHLHFQVANIIASLTFYHGLLDQLANRPATAQLPHHRSAFTAEPTPTTLTHDGRTPQQDQPRG